MNARLLTVSLLLVALVACSGSPSPNGEQDPSKGSGEQGATSAPTEPGANDNEHKVSTSWTDEKGYSYEIDLYPSDIETAVNTLDQKFGEALIEAKGTINYTLTNRTPNRNVGFESYVNGFTYPFFSIEDAPFCKDAIDGPVVMLRQGKTMANEGQKELAYCFVGVWAKGFPPAEKVGPNESVQGELMWSIELIVPEKSAQKSAEALAKPSFWARSSFAEKDGDLQGKNACFTAEYWVVAATSEAGKGICPLVETGVYRQ